MLYTVYRYASNIFHLRTSRRLLWMTQLFKMGLLREEFAPGGANFFREELISIERGGT